MGDFNPKVAYDGPLAVVVNRLSASASEIFAGAIQDYDRGVILGGQTFGKGTVQTLQPLEHGQLKLTHAKFYRISGKALKIKGLYPISNSRVSTIRLKSARARSTALYHGTLLNKHATAFIPTSHR